MTTPKVKPTITANPMTICTFLTRNSPPILFFKSMSFLVQRKGKNKDYKDDNFSEVRMLK